MKYGIDLSTYQRNINYNMVSMNTDFAILRIGYGVNYLPSSQKDNQFENHYNGLYGKIPIGGYYYAYANAIGEGRKEAENCLRYLGNKNLDLPIYYDLEDSSMRYINEVAREFVDTIKAAGYKPGIYCNVSWALNKVDLSQFQDCSIWIAMYGNNNGQIPMNRPYISYNVWQYTSRGILNGINGYVDLNIANDEYLQHDTTNKSNEEVAEEVINGLWGNNEDRRLRLESAGYNYNIIQNIVNQILAPKKSIDEIAQEVINGLWGNGEVRRNRLTTAGYNAQEVQNRVNELLNANNEITYTVRSGDTLDAIAKRYNTTVNSIAQKNNIQDINKIYVGQVLKI